MMNLFLRNGASQVCKYAFAYKIHTSSALQAMKDYYEILRVPKSATQADIKEAYYKLSKVYHPDVKKDESSLNMFRTITEAYDVLGNAKAREDYDKEKFSPKELIDTTKTSFYVSLHKERLKYGVIGTPDYEKIISRRTKRDQYLREEEKDRHMEVEMDRRKSYEHQMVMFGDYGQNRIFIVIFLAAVLKYSLSVCEDHFGWGLPDDYEEDWVYAPH
jgi:curved DNA-binding protein CbpA